MHMQTHKMKAQYWLEKWYDSEKPPLSQRFLSYIFRTVTYLRRMCYRAGILHVANFPVPIIVIGNITVGGTGKTPLLIELASWLRYQGFKPGIVSRGYGGNLQHYPHVVTEQSDPAEVGDEAVLTAMRTGCPVVVAPKRIEAIDYLLAEFSCDIVLSDDGLQHYAMGRDIECVVIDGIRRYGNGYCLPAGPLREPVKRLKAADFVLVNQGATSESSEFAFSLEGTEIYNLQQPNKRLSLYELGNSRVHAVAGIGHPERFFQTLVHAGLTNVQRHSFPDHHIFTPNDLIGIPEDEVILMTEKDAVKCRRFAQPNYWCLPVDAIIPEAFLEALLHRLRQIKKHD